LLAQGKHSTGSGESQGEGVGDVTGLLQGWYEQKENWSPT